MNINNKNSSIVKVSKTKGTLAIDLGNSTTVVAFQAENENSIKLLDLQPLSRAPGEIPSVIWRSGETKTNFLFGKEAEELFSQGLKKQDEFISNFKPWIGAPKEEIPEKFRFSPEKAGELLIKEIWKRIPPELEIKKLVLSSPVETYKEYRKWLHSICLELDVQEIALVDEPTAAAIGAGQPGGARILVLDMGGSTIDMSMVLLEGGEGKAEPIAQLIKFKGKDLEGISKQVIRGATVLGKSGLKLGGRDIDKWILQYLYPDSNQSDLLLNSAEKLKCRLSDQAIIDTKKLSEEFLLNPNQTKEKLTLSRVELEELLEDKGFFKSLSNLLETTLARGRSKGYELDDLTGVVMVGGCSRIPIIQKWLMKYISKDKLLTPPPIEAVAIGAIKLTPGVMVRDVLNRGISLRVWDQKNNTHSWHPLFLTGHPWPTIKPLEIFISTSVNNQSKIELKFAETGTSELQEVIYIKGIPNIREIEQTSNHKIYIWEDSPVIVTLDQPAEPGLDCLKLSFTINSLCQLEVKGVDIRSSNKVIEKIVGSIR